MSRPDDYQPTPCTSSSSSKKDDVTNISEMSTMIVNREGGRDDTAAASDEDDDETMTTANESNSFFVPETPMAPRAGKSAAATGAACDSYEMPTPFRTPVQTASTPRRLAAAVSSTPSCASFKVPESPLVLESSTDVSNGADSSASFIAPRCGRI